MDGNCGLDGNEENEVNRVVPELLVRDEQTRLEADKRVFVQTPAARPARQGKSERNASDVPSMRSQTRPKGSAHLTPAPGSMRKKFQPLPYPIRKTTDSFKARCVGIGMHTQQHSRKKTNRQPFQDQRPTSGRGQFNGIVAVVILLASLLAAALILTILEKPQATAAWSLVGTIYPTTVATLLGLRLRAGRRRSEADRDNA